MSYVAKQMTTKHKQDSTGLYPSSLPQTIYAPLHTLDTHVTMYVYNTKTKQLMVILHQGVQPTLTYHSLNFLYRAIL